MDVNTIFTLDEQTKIILLKGSAKHIDDSCWAYLKINIPQLNKFPYIIAGGVFVSKFHNEEPNDIDMFFLDVNEPVSIPDMSIVKKESKIEYMNNPDILRAFTVHRQFRDINVILTKYKTREDLMKHFDMWHCKMSYDPSCDGFFISRMAYDAVKNKKIIHANLAVPIKQHRIDKYLKRGYTI